MTRLVVLLMVGLVGCTTGEGAKERTEESEPIPSDISQGGLDYVDVVAKYLEGIKAQDAKAVMAFVHPSDRGSFSIPEYRFDLFKIRHLGETCTHADVFVEFWLRGPWFLEKKYERYVGVFRLGRKWWVRFDKPGFTKFGLWIAPRKVYGKWYVREYGEWIPIHEAAREWYLGEDLIFLKP